MTDTLRAKAVRLFKRGEYDSAFALLNRRIAKTDSDSEKSVLLTFHGNFFRQLKRYKEAAKSLSEAVAIRPKNWIALALLGRTSMESKNFDRAITRLRNASKLAPIDTHASLFTLIAISHLYSGRPSAAKDFAERALDIDPEWEEAQAIRDACLSELDSFG